MLILYVKIEKFYEIYSYRLVFILLKVPIGTEKINFNHILDPKFYPTVNFDNWISTQTFFPWTVWKAPFYSYPTFTHFNFKKLICLAYSSATKRLECYNRHWYQVARDFLHFQRSGKISLSWFLKIHERKPMFPLLLHFWNRIVYMIQTKWNFLL